MRVDTETKEAYDKHSYYTSLLDKKLRKYFFEIENLEEDYNLFKASIENYSNISFDFVASCIRKEDRLLRIFSKDITGRFGVSKNVNLKEFKDKLIKDGFVFAPKSKKSGPLCLNEDFSEPIRAKMFRLFLPLIELKMRLFIFRDSLLKN